MDYPNNSNMTQQQQPQLKPPEIVNSVISKPPKIREKNQKGLKSIIFDQDFKDIKDGIYENYVKPKIKEIVYNISSSIGDIINSTLQSMIFGDVRRPVNGGRRVGDAPSYNQYSKSSSRPITPSISVAYDCSGLSFESKSDADIVLITMQEHLTRYPWVSVAQMYEYAGLARPDYTSTNYGWDNLDGVKVKGTGDGDFYIDVPKAKPLPR